MGDINGVIIYMDDLLVFGETDGKHDVILRKVLDRILAVVLKLNKEKFIFRTKKVDALGHNVIAKGVKISREKM